MKAARRPRTILFLIADTGAGHRSAANAILAAMRGLEPRSTASKSGTHARTSAWQAVIVDAFAECSRFPLRNSVFLYGPAIKYSPGLYGQIFRITNSTARFNTARRLCQPFLRQGLRQLLERIRPDVIVSVHPLLNHITLQVLGDIGLKVPLITVVTDLVSIHCAWIAPGVDACIVPTDAARAAALAAGLPARRVHQLGMPIHPKFAAAPSGSKSERRAALGLDPDLPVVLLVGGGEGAGGLADAAETLAHAALPAQLVVIAGRNQALRAELERERHGFATLTHVYGFVENMPDFMHAADVIVTKAGPGTITEAMACQLPIVLTGAVPGQEEGNVDYVLDNGLGVLVSTPDELVTTLRSLLDPAEPLLGTLRENVRRLSRADASARIGRLILGTLPDPAAPSVWSHAHRPLPRSHPVMGRPAQVLLPRLPFVARGRGPRALRAPLRRHGRPVRSEGAQALGLARLARVRALLMGETGEAIQLRRPGGRRRGHDARAAVSRRRG